MPFRASTLFLGVIFLLHIAIRCFFIETRPLASLGVAYPHTYSSSLSLLAGQGFQRLELDDSPASQKVKDFLDLKSEKLTQADFWECSEGLSRLQTRGSVGSYAYVDSASPLGIYSAALVWKAFGISWKTLQYFYLLLSVLAFVSLVTIAQRVTEHRYPAVLSATLFAVSFESWEGVIDFRDVSPMWFTAYAFAILYEIGGRKLSPSHLYAALASIGIVVAIGCGFRRDLMILPPFVVFAVSLLLKKHNLPLRQIGQGVFTLLVAYTATWTLVQNSYNQQSANSGNFHVAYFGNQARGDLLGVENSLQIFRDDAKVTSDAIAFHGKPLPFLSPEYGQVTWEMYLQAFRYHAFHWTSHAPLALWIATTSEPPSKALNLLVDIPLGYVGYQALKATGFILMLIGALSLFWQRGKRAEISLLVLFFFYYTVVWFAVDPNPRHWAPFIVPYYSLAAVGLATAIELFRRREARFDRHILKAALELLLVWIASVALTFFLSQAQRSFLLEAAFQQPELAREQVAVKEVTIDSGKPQSDTRHAYLLTLKAGSQPADILCKHLRLSEAPFVLAGWEPITDSDPTYTWARNTLWWSSYHESRHRLNPDGTQKFLVTFIRNNSGGDQRHYKLKVSVEGDAMITEVVTLDFSNWRHLQLSTVIAPDTPIGPKAATPNSRTLIQFPPTQEQLVELGFP